MSLRAAAGRRKKKKKTTDRQWQNRIKEPSVVGKKKRLSEDFQQQAACRGRIREPGARCAERSRIR